MYKKMINKEVQSTCVSLPNWIMLEGFKRYVCVYKEIIPYIYNSEIKQNCLYINEDVLRKECEGLNEIYMAISNIKPITCYWGDITKLSCWNYLSRETVRESLINKWVSLLKNGGSFNIDSVKRLFVGIHLISQGCVSYNDPCSVIANKEIIDRRIINALLTDLTYCPIHK